MATDRKRNRLVSFRLSEQEYQILYDSTRTGGARSISDFARRALLDSSERGTPVTVGNDTLEQLVMTMGELNRVINRLSALVETNSHSPNREQNGA